MDRSRLASILGDQVLAGIVQRIVDWVARRVNLQMSRFIGIKIYRSTSRIEVRGGAPLGS